MTTELVFLRCLVLRLPEQADQAFKFKKDAGESNKKSRSFFGDVPIRMDNLLHVGIIPPKVDKYS